MNANISNPCWLSFLAVFATLCFSGCTSDESSKKAIVIKRDLDVLLNHKMFDLQTQVSKAKNISPDQVRDDTAIFTPSSKGYSVVHTNVGFLIVSLESLTRYANGYRVTFEIGNPSYITYDGVTISLEWGEDVHQKNKSDLDWIRALRSEEVEVNKPILPGMWNRVSVILAPAKSKDTGYISASFKINRLYLRPDHRLNSHL